MTAILAGILYWGLGQLQFTQAIPSLPARMGEPSREEIILSAQLTQLFPTEMDKRVFELMKTSWGPDPFTLEPARALRPDPTTEAPFVYHGFLNVGGQLIAIVNGRELREGDFFPGSPFQVHHIMKDAIIFRRVPGQDTIRIPFGL